MAKKPTKDKLFAEVIETAVEFHKRRLWTQVDSDDPISIRVEGEEYPILCFVLGSESMELGLSALRGEHALDGFEKFIRKTGRFGDNAPCDLLMVTFEMFSEITPEFLQPLQKSGRVFGKSSAAPLFLSHPASERGRTRSTFSDLGALCNGLGGGAEGHPKAMTTFLGWKSDM